MRCNRRTEIQELRGTEQARVAECNIPPPIKMVGVGIILSLVHLGFLDHALNLVLQQASLVVGNGNLVLPASEFL